MLLKVLNYLRMKHMAKGLFRGHIFWMLLRFPLFGSLSHETSYPL